MTYDATRVSARDHLLPLAAAGLLAACGGTSAEPSLDTFDPRLEAAAALAEAHPGALDAFADGRHDFDDIEKGRIPAPPGGSPIEQEMLRIVEAAETYAEAILLARVVGQVPGELPALPAALRADAKAADYEFAGRNVTLPYAVQKALEERREARDETLDVLDEASFRAYAEDAVAKHAGLRRRVAERLGWPFDARPDLYVVDAADGTIWRRKQPAGYVAPTEALAPSSAPFAPGAKVDEEDVVDFEEGVQPAIIGADFSKLRSRDNGYTMGGAAWEPKGAIVDNNRTTQEVPVEVDCSGTKISARLVATAGHCMWRNGAWNDNTKWIPGADGVDAAMNGRDPSPNGYKNRWTRIVRGWWHDFEWSNYDFGVFVLYDNSSSCSLHWHGWRMKNPSGDYVHLYGFPGERRQCADSPRSDGWCGGSIYGHGRTVNSTNSYRMFYTFDTQPGHSGSGVYEITSGDRYVVGTHRGAYSSTRNDGVYITSGNRDLIVDATNDHPANACN